MQKMVYNLHWLEMQNVVVANAHLSDSSTLFAGTSQDTISLKYFLSNVSLFQTAAQLPLGDTWRMGPAQVRRICFEIEQWQRRRYALWFKYFRRS